MCPRFRMYFSRQEMRLLLRKLETHALLFSPYRKCEMRRDLILKYFAPTHPLPSLFQIAMPKGVIQDWGLVEFFNPKDSEATQTKLNGHLLRGYRIRVHFCIPGVNAINIYMQVSLVRNAQIEKSQIKMGNDSRPKIRKKTYFTTVSCLISGCERSTGLEEEGAVERHPLGQRVLPAPETGFAEPQL